MVKKEEILKDMEYYLGFEEDGVRKISDFCLSLCWQEYVPKDKHAFIEDSLGYLKNDGLKHVKLVNEIINYIKRSPKDEF